MPFLDYYNKINAKKAFPIFLSIFKNIIEQICAVLTLCALSYFKGPKKFKNKEFSFTCNQAYLTLLRI